jgi:NAD(P)-dependent dehydrogenase (short-subunit alcohol dehydrogenase family)
MTINLTGKTALVTGGSRGIGAAAVLALADAGAQVTYTSRHAGGPSGDLITALQADVTDLPTMAAIMAQPFDILVNNAGVIGPIGRIDQVAPQDWAQNITTNLTGAYAVIHHAIRANPASTIINLSSGAARRPLEGWSAYCSGKAGLAMLTRAAHEEFAPQGLRIFGLAPGVVDTDMQGEIRASGINPVSQLPRATLAPVTDPAAAILFLTTPAADHYCGMEVDVREPTFRAAVGLPPLPVS